MSVFFHEKKHLRYFNSVKNHHSNDTDALMQNK